MILEVSFHKLAERELNDAASHYELQAHGLGTDLLAAVEHALDRISASPEIGHVVERRVRRMLAGRFPYALFYSVRPSELRIPRSPISGDVRCAGGRCDKPRTFPDPAEPHSVRRIAENPTPGAPPAPRPGLR